FLGCSRARLRWRHIRRKRRTRRIRYRRPRRLPPPAGVRNPTACARRSLLVLEVVTLRERGDVRIPGRLILQIAFRIGFDHDIDKLAIADVLHGMIREAWDIDYRAFPDTLRSTGEIQLRFAFEEQIRL